jgi:carbon monoxide dehydrogenase subunit G
VPTVTITTDLAAPPEAVWAVIADYSRGPEWQRGISRVKWTSPEPHGVGSTFEQTTRFMSLERTNTYEVTEHEPGRVTAIKSTSGMDLAVRRVLAPNSIGGTRVTETATGGPGGGARLFSPMMRITMEKNIRADYERLKELLRR